MADNRSRSHFDLTKIDSPVALTFSRQTLICLICTGLFIGSCGRSGDLNEVENSNQLPLPQQWVEIQTSTGYACVRSQTRFECFSQRDSEWTLGTRGKPRGMSLAKFEPVMILWSEFDVSFLGFPSGYYWFDLKPHNSFVVLSSAIICNFEDYLPASVYCIGILRDVFPPNERFWQISASPGIGAEAAAGYILLGITEDRRLWCNFKGSQCHEAFGLRSSEKVLQIIRGVAGVLTDQGRVIWRQDDDCPNFPCPTSTQLKEWYVGTNTTKVESSDWGFIALQKDGRLFVQESWRAENSPHYRTDYHEVDDPLQYRFRDFSVTEYLCGILESGEVRCWADDDSLSYTNEILPTPSLREPGNDGTPP